MNDRIKNVKNEVIELKDLKTNTGLKKCNMITVEFLHADEEKWRIRVETAKLISQADKGSVLKPVERNPHIGLTNCKSIDFFFEEDEMELTDGAEFSITVRTTVLDSMESYDYVLNNNEWVLKEDN